MMNNRCCTCIHCEVCDIGMMEEMSRNEYCQDWNGWDEDNLPEVGDIVLVRLNPRDCVVGYNDVELAMLLKDGSWKLAPFMGGPKVEKDAVKAWRKVI